MANQMPRGIRANRVVVPQEWSAWYEETHVPPGLRIGDILHVSGHTGESEGGSFSDDPRVQIREAFARIGRTLVEAGATWSDVISITSYHVGLAAQKSVLLPLASEFLDPPFPAWTAVGVTGLWDAGAVVEISCIAVLGKGRK